MATKVLSTGMLVHGQCEEKVEGVCQFLTTSGQVFCYEVSPSEIRQVCKACADYLFDSGEWIPHGVSSDYKTSELRKYLVEMRNAYTVGEKIGVVAIYASKRWIIRVPLAGGDYLGQFWVTEINVQGFGWARIALKSNDETTPGVFRVRPPEDLSEMDHSNNAVLYAVDRIQ